MKRTACLRATRAAIGMCIAMGDIHLADAALRTWAGPADGNWHVAGNWAPSGIPANGDTVVVNTSSVTLTNATDELASFTITNAALTFTNWSTALIAADITIQDGGILTHSICDTNAAPGVTNRVYLVASNVTIDAGGKIDARQRGFPHDQGPGAGTSSSLGGSYGGDAGRRSGTTYGSPDLPEDPGSGGTANSATATAGGVVRIAATGGTVRVNGTIDASTIYTQEGPGSGGSILIECRVFDGSGILNASGGSAKPSGGSGGGGGRIAVHYDAAAQAVEAPAATSIVIMASGGRGGYTGSDGDIGNYGDPGTIYLSDTALLRQPDFNMSGRLLFANGTNWWPDTLALSGRQVIFPEDFSFGVTQALAIVAPAYSTPSPIGTAIGSLALSGSPHPQPRVGSLSMDYGLFYFTFNFTNPQPFVVDGDLTMTNYSRLRLYPGETNTVNGLPHGGRLEVAGSLTVHSNSTIHPYTVTTNGGSVEIRAANVAILAGGRVDAHGKGLLAKTGPGAPTFGGSKGAGHGGTGGSNDGNPGGGTYGSESFPTLPGSGGNAGVGGGVAWVVTDKGTVRLDGVIDTGTVYAQEGAGSGGSILVVCKTFEGDGALLAEGGDARTPSKGGGGGGRIAVLQIDLDMYQNLLNGVTGMLLRAEAPPDTFTGTNSVAPGEGNPTAPATAGTVYWGSMAPRGTIFYVR